MGDINDYGGIDLIGEHTDAWYESRSMKPPIIINNISSSNRRAHMLYQINGSRSDKKYISIKKNIY